MRRRAFISVLGGVASWPFGTARSQSVAGVRTVAVLMPSPEADPAVHLFETLRRALDERGWRDGKNLKLEVRWANNDEARTRALALELVALKPDLIVAPATSLFPVREATRCIPVIFLLINDPVGQGVVPNLAHPGGNLTGFTYTDFSIGGKLVELLKEIAPATARVLVLVDTSNMATSQWWLAISQAARRLGLEPRQAPVRAWDDIETAIHTFSGAAGNGLIVAGQSLFATNRERLAALATRERLPAVCGIGPVFARAGGLLSYGVEASDQFQRAAAYIDRILKGEKPGDLPVQQPTRYELAINARTAKALGITVPPILLQQADEVIE
jgi:putative ABC transport system substrate-binding protein